MIIKQKKFFVAMLLFLLHLQGLLFAARGSSYPFVSGDTFRAIANHVFDETNKFLDPEKVKEKDIIFLRTIYVSTFFNTVHPHIKQPYILITHNSVLGPIYLTSDRTSFTGTSYEKYLEDPKLIAWFAQNIDYIHPKLHPIPVGIANSHWRHGNVAMFKRAIHSIPPLDNRSSKVYVNFSPNTNRHRRRLLAQSKKLSFCYVTKPKSPDAYLNDLKKFKYVLSPPGNGVDCHRTWEALLMGCIPIVKHSHLDPFFKDLPVILINSWSEMTPKFLEEKYRELQTKDFKFEQLYADYWINKIESYRK